MRRLAPLPRAVLAVAMGASLSSLGCDPKTEQKPAAPAAAPPAPAPEPKPAPEVETCPDLSKLDVASLPALPEGEHVAVLQAVWQRVLDKHYDPTLGCVDWVALRSKYAQRVAAADSRSKAYAIIDEMLGELEQSHFKLFPPEADEATAARGAYTVPLTLRWIDGQLLVVRSEEGPSHVPPGSVVVQIGKTTVETIAAREGAEHSLEADKARAIVRRAEGKLSCRLPGQTRKLKVMDPTRDDKMVDYEVTCEEPEGELITFGNLTNVPTRVEHRMLDGTEIGYLSFNVWMLPMVARVKSALDELKEKGMTGLVLDLRGNPGGVGPMSVPIAQMLVPKGGELGTLKFRNFSQTFTVKPDEKAFGGPIALLVDEGTASTSEIFAAGLRDLGRVTIVGPGPSAGAALPSVIEELPGGAVLQYVVGDYHSPKGTAVEGAGLKPDILVNESRQDFVTGRDPVLEAAIEHLQRS